MAQDSRARTIEITVAEYFELLKTETRIELLQEYAERSKYLSREDMLTILGINENKEA